MAEPGDSHMPKPQHAYVKHGDSDVQIPVSAKSKPVYSTAKRRAARDIVIAARAAGMSFTECAREAGVSVKTAERYAANINDMSREGVISMLSLRLASKSTPDQYIAPLTAILSKLQGWTDKVADTVRLIPMGALFASWRDECRRADNAELTPAHRDNGVSTLTSNGEPGGEPPIASENESGK